MMNTTQTISLNVPKHHYFGARLKSAREALGMDRKDVASQLRLQEKMIILMENGEYKSDIPMTFIRGYIRNYCKLLGIPEKEVNECMESLKPKPEIDESTVREPASPYLSTASPNNDQYMSTLFGQLAMPIFTCLIAITLIGLVAMWWNSHKATQHDLSSPLAAVEKLPENTIALPPEPEKNTVTQVNIPVQKDITVIIDKNPLGKAAFIRYANNGFDIKLLADFILFLIILTASMRIYAKPAMAGVRSKRIQHPRRPVFNAGALIRKMDVKLKPLLPILIFGIILVAAIYGGWLLYSSHQSTPKPNQAPVAVKTEEPVDQLPLYANLETLAPSSTMVNLLLAGIKPYDLQAMTMQLDYYIGEAAATKFALTDRSMPIGQFARKKRRHRHNAAPENFNNAPRYYFERYQQ